MIPLRSRADREDRFRVSSSPRRAFAANSALAFATAELLTAALHETGHGLAAQALGFAPRIYPFFENNPSGTKLQTFIIVAAGPTASLLLGAFFLAIFARQAPHYSFGRLLLLWLGWLGVMEFVNYLVVTPWLSAGDTARIADLFGWSALPRYAVAAVGIGIVFVLARPAAISLCATAPAAFALDSPSARRRFIRNGFYFPLIAGTVLTAAGGIGTQPLAVGLGLLGTFGNIDIVSVAFRGANREMVVRERCANSDLRLEPIAVALYLIVVGFYIVVLSRGLPV